MTDTIQMRAIANRRRTIQDELAALQEKAAALKAEDGELEIAARVLQRLGVAAEETMTLPMPLPFDDGQEPRSRPSLREMITAVIGDYTAAGAPGATNAQVLAAIKQRWGEVDPNQVRPTLWRLEKNGHLAKVDGVYSFPIGVEIEPRRSKARTILDRMAEQDSGREPASSRPGIGG